MTSFMPFPKRRGAEVGYPRRSRKAGKARGSAEQRPAVTGELAKSSLRARLCSRSVYRPIAIGLQAARRVRVVPIPDLMLEVQLVDRGTANSVRGTGAGTFRDQRPGSGIACSQDRGSPSCYTASPVTAKIDRLVLGGQVRRRPARSGGSGQRLLRAALRRARLF